MKHRILLAGVIYPSVMHYFAEMAESITEQTDKDFDVLIVNDGVEKDIYIPGGIKVIGSEGSPSANRMQTIRYAIANGYDYIGWFDADDRLTETRVEQLKMLIDENPEAGMIIHNLDLIDEDSKSLDKTFINRESGKITISDILFYNLAGFGNTVVKVSELKDYILNLPDVKAVDWMLFSCMLIRGVTAVFVSKSLYEYRIYSGNMSGCVQSKAEFLKHAEIVREHYDALGATLKPVLSNEQTMALAEYRLRLKDASKYDFSAASVSNTGLLWWEDIYRILMKEEE